ncbi:MULTISPECIES: DUF6998 domain-containing protein [Deefgea]|uniref:DUF6998 domain-containing protein n=1 Tax=Deefgea chitinilytica TaxID=570276 RepID=A0ABS2CCN0_9NEIS|nr:MULTISPECIES: hypothetical protein [Deefgea]MBM5571116.1 hypothetical protein [Deefgea chitinilytica]MBM9888346.1 hypothetical protein [Deefgea sp. CFH1-16]
MSSSTISNYRVSADLIKASRDAVLNMTGKRLNLLADYAELDLCARFNMELCLKTNNPGYDAVDSSGKCVQIKARAQGKSTKPHTINSTPDHQEFDYYLFAFYDNEYNLVEVWKMARDKQSEVFPDGAKHGNRNRMEQVSECLFSISSPTH